MFVGVAMSIPSFGLAFGVLGSSFPFVGVPLPVSLSIGLANRPLTRSRKSSSLPRDTLSRTKRIASASELFREMAWKVMGSMIDVGDATIGSEAFALLDPLGVCWFREPGSGS